MRKVMLFTLLCSACQRQEQIPFQEANLALIANPGFDGTRLGPKQIALTFDDGPDESTFWIAWYLETQGIHATFFQNGKRYCRQLDVDNQCVLGPETRGCDNGAAQVYVADPIYYPESLMDTIQNLGHHVANHSQDHCNLFYENNDDNLSWEVQTTQNILDRHIKDGFFAFRAPYGSWNNRDSDVIHQNQALNKLVGPVVWNIDGGDFACWANGLSVNQCVALYMKSYQAAGKHGVVLMHDRPEWNVTSLQPFYFVVAFVKALQADGVEFVDLTGAVCPIRDDACVNRCGNIKDLCGRSVHCDACPTYDQVACPTAIETCKGKCGTVISACNIPVDCGRCPNYEQLACPTAIETCAGKCGTVLNTCNIPIDCGRCPTYTQISSHLGLGF